MMKSMTGIGRAKGRIGSSHFMIEVKSINHRYCEVYTRFPSRFMSFDLQVQQLIKSTVSRGKFDVALYEDRAAQELPLNVKSLHNYQRFLNTIIKELKISEKICLDHVLAGQNVWSVRDTDIQELWPDLKKLLEKALKELVRMREGEGKNLKQGLLERLKTMEDLYKDVYAKRGEVVKTYKEKLEKRITKLNNGFEIDPVKLANEVAFLADKSDISEELDRLKSHFQMMKKMFSQKKPQGRSMDFLIQEMNREWNTIGSKAQNAAIAQLVVQAKSELEKIREQVQNIE